MNTKTETKPSQAKPSKAKPCQAKPATLKPSTATSQPKAKSKAVAAKTPESTVIEGAATTPLARPIAPPSELALAPESKSEFAVGAAPEDEMKSESESGVAADHTESQAPNELPDQPSSTTPDPTPIALPLLSETPLDTTPSDMESQRGEGIDGPAQGAVGPSLRHRPHRPISPLTPRFRAAQNRVGELRKLLLSALNEKGALFSVQRVGEAVPLGRTHQDFEQLEGDIKRAAAHLGALRARKKEMIAGLCSDPVALESVNRKIREIQGARKEARREKTEALAQARALEGGTAQVEVPESRETDEAQAAPITPTPIPESRLRIPA